MKLKFLLVVFFLSGAVFSGNEDVKESVDVEFTDEDFFYEVLRKLIKINGINKIKVQNLNSLGVMGRILLEDAIVFVVQFLKKNENFAVKLLQEKIIELKDNKDNTEIFNVENFVILKSCEICLHNIKDLKKCWQENINILKEGPFLRVINCFNLHFNLDDIKLPKRLFLSYIATKDIEFLIKMFNLYLNIPNPLFENVKDEFEELKSSDDIDIEKKDNFKKKVFYFVVLDIIKSEFVLLKTQILNILDNELVEGLVKINLKNEISKINGDNDE